jgi:hypothetical protein
MAQAIPTPLCCALRPTPVGAISTAENICNGIARVGPCWSQWGHSCWQTRRPPGASNQGHSIAVRQRTCARGECICSGRADLRARLNEYGPTPRDLRRGLRCIVADFDGNGAVDYALPGTEGSVTVILSTRRGDFLRAEWLDASGIIHLYNPRDQAGPNGEPRLHGLFVPWVGQSHAMFLWNGAGFARTLFRPSTP